MKSFLNEKKKQDLQRPSKLPRIKDGSVAEKCDSAASHSAKRPDVPEVPPPDSDCSTPGGVSDGEQSDDAGAGDVSSEPGDADLFAGKFAIKDVDQNLGRVHSADRFGSLPRSVSKHLDQFEQQVLQSIPNNVSETLWWQSALLIFSCYIICPLTNATEE